MTRTFDKKIIAGAAAGLILTVLTALAVPAAAQAAEAAQQFRLDVDEASPALAAVVARCLNREPDARFSDGHAVEKAIERAAEQAVEQANRRAS